MPDSSDIGVRARKLLRESVVWDNHGCLPLRADASFLPELGRYLSAGVNVISINVGFAEMSWDAHLKILSFMRRWIALRPETFHLIRGVDDIDYCKSAGRLGVVFDIEGMCPVQHDPSLIQTFYELGVRWMLIAYNRNNAAGGGCLDADGGLTEIGRAAIDEMARVGMVLCLSHTGARTASEALEYSRSPVIFSHSNPYGHTRHVRNISDELIRRCADTGGVIGLAGLAQFLGGTESLVERLLWQLRYTIDLVGPEHVGLGLDYVFDRAELADLIRLNPTLFPSENEPSGVTSMVEPEALGAIAEGLAKDNLSDLQIRGVLGENWLRIARQVWK